MPEPKEYITKIMQIPDRLKIFLLYLTCWNCNDDPGAMASPAPAATPVAPPAPPAPAAPPGMTVLGVANLEVI